MRSLTLKIVAVVTVVMAMHSTGNKPQADAYYSLPWYSWHDFCLWGSSGAPTIEEANNRYFYCINFID